MSQVSVPTVPKWPFFLGDLLLLSAAILIGWQLRQGSIPITPAYVALIFLAVAVGAWFSTSPFLREHEAAVRASEQRNLSNTLAQIRQVEAAGNQIHGALAQLSAAGQSLSGLNEQAQKLLEDMNRERGQFTQFLQKANQEEAQTARLEIDKLRRGEQETVEVIVHLLDHTYALNQAAQRSGQPALIQQLGAFRTACLDVVRRIGLVAHEAPAGDNYNPDAHLPHDGKEVAPGSPIAGTYACGYTLRGMPVRRIVVVTQDSLQSSGVDVAPVAGVDPA